MKIEIKSEEDAARFWIQRDFSMIPHDLIERAFPDREDLELLAGGERKSSCCDADVSEHGRIGEPDTYFTCHKCEERCETHWGGPTYAWPAAHGWMFHPDESMDEDWIREHADEIADKCGLYVYDSESTGILLGIDGGGYDFYDAHWLPLYRLRGFQWHAQRG